MNQYKLIAQKKSRNNKLFLTKETVISFFEESHVLNWKSSYKCALEIHYLVKIGMHNAIVNAIFTNHT